MPTTNVANSGTWLKLTNTEDVLPVPIGFVVEHGVEIIPTHFANGAGKLLVLHHSRRVERFQTNCIVLIDYLSRCFMQEIPALVSNRFVKFGNNHALLMPVLRLFSRPLFKSAGHCSLFNPKAFERTAQKLVILENLWYAIAAIGKNGKGFHAKVNAYGSVTVDGLLYRLVFAGFYQKRYEVLTRWVAAHRDRFNGSCERSTESTLNLFMLLF